MPLEDLKTVILRFRDLVTTSGETIKLHADIAERSGHVWWGWWNKAGETIPDDAFRLLNGKAQAGGLEVLLFDSGTLRFYRALCWCIVWDAEHRPIHSPDPAQTPDYYRTKEYLAWFQLSDIREDTPDLKELSYYRVDDFFDTRESHYDAFYNKVIVDGDELRQQDRSIWFVQVARPEHPVHKVSILDPMRVRPCHYTERFSHREATTLLWVSDTHFSHSSEYHAFPVGSTTASQNLGLRIEAALSKLNVPVAGMIVSGDLTWSAQSAEYELAQVFLRRIMSYARLDSYDIALCPGNHDIAYSDSHSERETVVEAAPPRAKEAWARLYRDLFYLNPNEFLSSGRRFLLGQAVPVEVVCLNSSPLEQQEHCFRGHGFVGEPQLDDVARGMGWDPCRDGHVPIPTRIVVMHHHLIRVPYREVPRHDVVYSATLDAEAVIRWVLRHRVRLVLHGHAHQPYICRISRPVTMSEGPECSEEWPWFYVAGIGSAGAAHDRVGEIGRNVFALLSFGRQSVTIDVHSVHPVNDSERCYSFTLQLNE